MNKMLGREKSFFDSPSDLNVSPRSCDSQYSEHLVILNPILQRRQLTPKKGKSLCLSDRNGGRALVGTACPVFWYSFCG